MNRLSNSNTIKSPRRAIGAATLALVSLFTLSSSLDIKHAAAAVSTDAANPNKNQKIDKLTKKEKQDRKVLALEKKLEIPTSEDPLVLLEQQDKILEYIYKSVLLYGKDSKYVEPWYKVLYADPAQREIFMHQLDETKEYFKAPPADKVDINNKLVLSSVGEDGMPYLRTEQTIVIEYPGYSDGWQYELLLAQSYFSAEVTDPRTNEMVPTMQIALVEALSDQEKTRLSDL